MVSAEDVFSIYKKLTANGIRVWITGGWGIDALLGEETRPHKDLDVILLLDDITRMCELMGSLGYHFKETWEENLWIMDAQGTRTATAFVLQDTEGRELDAHAIRLDERGNGIPAWEEKGGFIFSAKDLAGEGRIAGLAVKCLTPEKQMQCHMGYEIPEKQLRDLERLHEKFGVEYPDEFYRSR